MRLVFAISSLGMGGAQRVAINLIREWQARGWKITLVVTFSGGGSSSYYDIPVGVEVVYLADLVKSRWGGRIAGQLRRVFALRRLIKVRQADRVLAFVTDANLFAIAASFGLGIKVIVSERNYPPAEGGSRLYGKARLLLYPYADRVVIQTYRGLEWVARAIPTARGMAIANPVVLPLPTSLPTLDPTVLLDAETRLILAAGRLVPEKGFDVLIDAFACCCDRQSRWQLAIVGEGPERAALEHRIAAADLIGRVHLFGPAGNIADWYQRAEIFALTSRYEGFPNTLLEAMAHGCAVVSFDCDTGPADMIVNNENGLLLGRLPDTETLAQALNTLMTDDQRRQSLANAARGVSQRFSMAAILTQWDIALNVSPVQGEHA